MKYFSIMSKYIGTQSIDRIIRKFDRFFLGFISNDRKDRPKNFFFPDTHISCDISEKDKWHIWTGKFWIWFFLEKDRPSFFEGIVELFDKESFLFFWNERTDISGLIQRISYIL